MKEMMAKAKKDKEDANKRGEFPIDQEQIDEAKQLMKDTQELAD
jgi:hypothetical protein